MTNEELIAKINAEIERLYDGEAPKHDQQCDFSDGYFTALSRIDEFLDTIESEKPIEGLEDEAVSYCFDNGLNLSPRVATDIARHFAQWGAEHLVAVKLGDEIAVNGYKFVFDKDENAIKVAKVEPNGSPEDLEEAADKFAVFYDQGTCDGVAQDCFIAGAKWQADHTPLPEDTVLFNKGVEEGKRLMMEDAVKWLVDDDYNPQTDKGRFIFGSVGIGYNGYYIPYSDLLKLPKEDDQ